MHGKYEIEYMLYMILDNPKGDYPYVVKVYNAGVELQNQFSMFDEFSNFFLEYVQLQNC